MNNQLFDNLEIRQFRAFDFLKIEQLGHINLFLGKNNVGKSTLLEALWLYANLGSPEVIRSILEERGEPGEIRHGGAVEPTVWNLFHGHPSLEQITSSIQIGRISSPDSALSLSIQWLPTRNESDDPKNLDNGKIPALVVKYGPMHQVLHLDDAYDDLCRRWNLQARSIRDLATPCILIGPGGLTDTDLHSLWEKVVLTDSKIDVIEAMRIIAPEVEDFAFMQPRAGASSIRLRLEGQEEPMSLKTMGDGMNRLFGLGMALACTKNGILLIDEVENGIHWSVLPEVWKFIVKVVKRLNVQVFATTHSHDCLKAFHAGTKGAEGVDGVAVRIERKGGEFKTENFDEKRLAVIVKEGIEIR